MNQTLPGTSPLTWTGDLGHRMVAGIHRWLDRDLLAAVAARPVPGPDSAARLHALLGSYAVDRVPGRLELVATPEQAEPGWWGAATATASWPSGGRCIARPSARACSACRSSPSQTSSRCRTANRLPNNSAAWPPGSLPRRSSRGDWPRRAAVCWSPPSSIAVRGGVHGPRGNESVHPKREFLYRAAYEVGRTMIGLELDMVLAGREALGDDLPCGVAGYGEGGLLALYAMAVEDRFVAGWTSGYFGPRSRLWREPLDRNVYGLLNEFGDAQIAAMAGSRPLIIELGPAPSQQLSAWDETTHHLTPGEIVTPEPAAVRDEAAQAEVLGGQAIVLADGPATALDAFCAGLGVAPADEALPPMPVQTTNPAARVQRLFDGYLALTQRLVEGAEARRETYWAELDRSSVESFTATAEAYRQRFWEHVIGPVPEPDRPLEPRTRLRYEDDLVTCWDVVLGVYEDAFAYGILVLPKGIAGGERRPVVVCQHGLEGRSENGALPEESPAYRKWGYQLATRGFVVFCPQNPYLGFDHFRTVQRKAHPLRKTLFSFIVRQHQRILEWLSQQPFVDPERIAFYGISYGGKTALRVPAMLSGYCLSICSGDFNEWLRKNARIDYPNGYLFTYEYEMPDFDLGGTFNYAEMSWLIFPRPFMVERGHADGCANDQWLAYEWAKTFAAYNLLGIPDRAEIEWFDGGHTIHGQGTFAFLHKWLEWPAPEV